MTSTRLDSPTEIRPSPIAGMGVFATEAIADQTVVWSETPKVYANIVTEKMMEQIPQNIRAAVYNEQFRQGSKQLPLDVVAPGYMRLAALIYEMLDWSTWTAVSADAARIDRETWFAHCALLATRWPAWFSQPNPVFEDMYRTVVACSRMALTPIANMLLGAGLYLGGIHRLNHSCYPNCTLVFDAQRARVVTVRPVAAGDELTISYRPRTSCNIQVENRVQWGWDCACTHCHKRPVMGSIFDFKTRHAYQRIGAQAEKALAAYQYPLARMLYERLFRMHPHPDVIDSYLTTSIASGHVIDEDALRTIRRVLADPASIYMSPEALAAIRLALGFLAYCRQLRDVAGSMADSLFDPKLAATWKGCIADVATVGDSDALLADAPWIPGAIDLWIAMAHKNMLFEVADCHTQMLANATYLPPDIARRPLEIPQCRVCKQQPAVVVAKPCLCTCLCVSCAGNGPVLACPACNGPVDTTREL